MVFLHGAAVEAAELGGVAKVADGAFVEAADNGIAGGVAVADCGVVHKEFFAVDEAELVAIALGEDFIEVYGQLDGALVIFRAEVEVHMVLTGGSK